MADLYKIVEKSVRHSMNDYQLYHKGRLVDRIGNQRLMDYGIKAESTLMVAKKRKGIIIDITNPLVSTPHEWTWMFTKCITTAWYPFHWGKYSTL